MNRTCPGRWLALMLWLCCTGAVADIYRWTDADGRVHYGDRPPASGAEKIIEPPPPSELSAEEINARLEAIRARREAAAEERAKAKEERAKADAERQQRAQECAAMQRQLDSMRAAHRIRDAEGNWYTGEQRLDKQRELEKAIRKRCSGL